MENLEKFLALSVEKRDNIINSALFCFGNYGYEKASINDIAKGAGISKESVFQYFGNKNTLYEYLIEYATSQMKSAYRLDELDECEDFFERVWKASVMKVENLKKHPDIAKFITVAVNERQSEELSDEKNWESFVSQMLLREKDLIKFKNRSELKTLFKTFMLIAQGMSTRLEDGNYDEVMEDFREILEMFKLNFYKEEYL